LEFTLTSPFGQSNDINIFMTYTIGDGTDMRVNVDIELYRDPAHVFHARSDQQILSNILFSFFSEEIMGRYSSSFRAEENRSDYIRVTGSFYEQIPETPSSNRFLVATQSPYVEILKNYFVLPKRENSFEFDYAFNISETVNFKFDDDFRAMSDSLILSFNERGVKAELNVLTSESSCQINKKFNLFDYDLTADRYNRFVDFLLIASQISYNSIELLKADD